MSAQKGTLFSLCCKMGDTRKVLIFNELGVDSNCCSERTYSSKSIKNTNSSKLQIPKLQGNKDIWKALNNIRLEPEGRAYHDF